jgi:hypothetical protein
MKAEEISEFLKETGGYVKDNDYDVEWVAILKKPKIRKAFVF